MSAEKDLSHHKFLPINDVLFIFIKALKVVRRPATLDPYGMFNFVIFVDSENDEFCFYSGFLKATLHV